MKRIVSAAAALVLSLSGGYAKEKVSDVSSPDGNIKVEVSVGENISYSVWADGTLVLDSCSLSMALESEVLGVSPKLRKVSRDAVSETVKREVPLKNAYVKNAYNALTMDFAGGYSVEFRAFDNGVAYRFILDRKGEAVVLDEDFSVNFADDCMLHVSRTSGFKTSYESPYSHLKVSEYGSDAEMTYLPVLAETESGYNVLISESDLRDYPCIFLKGTGDKSLRSVFPRCPLEFGYDGDRSVSILKEAGYIARTSADRTFPWRFFVISKDDREIVSNEMAFVLASPCEIDDCSWIRPGQVSWEWWHDARLYGVDFRSGYNTESYKYYIDFASAFGIPYIIMDEGWAKTTTDPFTPNPDVDVHELVRYGAEKNVKVILWLTWLTVENHMDTLFKTVSEWGVAGFKIDFMDRSDQWMVNFYERVAKEAAKYRMVIDFHGSFKPAGLERRYPNILSYEGVLGMEQGGNCHPSNTIYLPFMRNAVGPMDFTPGSMLSAQPEDNRYTRANAMGSGTRAYQMALYVVFESGIQMLADNPVYYYRERPCTEFISSVPTVWDETRVLDAKVGDYVVIARRSGSRWFIGAITDENGRTLEVSLDFLGDGAAGRLTYFEDGINADRQAMDYRKGEKAVDSSTKLTLNLTRNGGWAGVIEQMNL